jgi:hypothetical protein
MDSSLVILTLSVMSLPVCQAKALTSHKYVTGLYKHNDGLNDNRKYPKAEDYNNRRFNTASRKSSNKAFHPYGLDTLGQGNIFWYSGLEWYFVNIYSSYLLFETGFNIFVLYIPEIKSL